MPATTMAPRGPDRTISSILASSVSGDEGASWDTIMMSLLQWRGAERVGFGCRDRSAVIAPGNPDVGHHGGNFIVRKRLGERRHSVRHRIGGCPRRIAAIENHPYRVDGRRHLDRLIVGERRIVR